MERQIGIKKSTEGEFYFLDFGSELHGRISYRVWIARALVSWAPCKLQGSPLIVTCSICGEKPTDQNCHPQAGEVGKIRFPVENATLHKTERGTLVLRPGKNTVFDYTVGGGFRGDSSFEILHPEPVRCEWYRIYGSPRGSLGIDSGALIEVPSFPVKISWKKTGRTYGKPRKGIDILSVENGKLIVSTLDELADGIEELGELKQLTQD